MRTHGELHSAAPLGDQATGTITQYLAQSHYPDIVLTRACRILAMPRTRLGSDKNNFKSHFFLTQLRVEHILGMCC